MGKWKVYVNSLAKAHHSAGGFNIGYYFSDVINFRLQFHKLQLYTNLLQQENKHTLKQVFLISYTFVVFLTF